MCRTPAPAVVSVSKPQGARLYSKDTLGLVRAWARKDALDRPSEPDSPVAQVLCKLNDSRKLAVLPLIKVLEALAAA